MLDVVHGPPETEKEPQASARFAPLPLGCSKPKSYTTWATASKDHLYAIKRSDFGNARPRSGFRSRVRAKAISDPRLAHAVDKLQLDQARADLATAEANLSLSQTTMARWQDLLKRDAVAKQETEDKIGDYQAKKAMVESGRANVKRLEDLVSFEKVYAPFAGVITARNTDIGALIPAVPEENYSGIATQAAFFHTSRRYTQIDQYLTQLLHETTVPLPDHAYPVHSQSPSAVYRSG